MIRLATVLFVVAWAVTLPPMSGQVVPYGGAAEYVQDLAARRARLARTLGDDTVLVLWSAPPRVYSTDTNYEYRQESNLLYLTGLDDEDVTLVLVGGASAENEFLFVRARDPFRELWTGPIASVTEVRARTGIQRVFAQRRTEAFDAFMRGMFRETSPGDTPGPPGTPAAPGATVSPAIDDAAAAGRAAGDARTSWRLALIEHASATDRTSGSLEPAPAAQVAWARGIAARHENIRLLDATAPLDRQRQVKTPYEQRVMRRSVEISAEAHIEGMRATRPGRWEYEVEAAIEHWFLRNGAMSWGYPSIVGSGPNATILHYLKSTRQMQSGDLLLVDAAANFQGLTGDITRTYPVNGRFSRDQRALYDIVLRAQEAGIAAARPGGSVGEINGAVRAEIGRGLLSVGLVTDQAAATGESAQIDLWFPHGPVHGIGVDVHEPLGDLVPGTTFVVEPGIYVRPDTLDRLAADPARAELAAVLRPAVMRFLNMGIRIEDSLLMTASGVEVMSVKVPKRASEVERLIGTR
jgi:Xaa-Pro aminopeptidase